MKNMGKSMPPVEVRKMMYEKAVNRCVVAKGDTMKNMKLNRAAVGQVVTYCAIIAAQNLFDLDRDGVERWQAELIRRSEVYTLETNVYGALKARENLRKRTAPKMKEDFTLPVEKWPRKEWERVQLYERRGAGDLVARFFVEVMDGLGYTTEEIAAALKEIQGDFRQFLEWSKDGEYVAYYKMAQCHEQATGIEAAIDEEPGAKPIFGKEI